MNIKEILNLCSKDYIDKDGVRHVKGRPPRTPSTPAHYRPPKAKNRGYAFKSPYCFFQVERWKK